jgi:hypothetical protein
LLFVADTFFSLISIVLSFFLFVIPFSLFSSTSSSSTIFILLNTSVVFVSLNLRELRSDKKFVELFKNLQEEVMKIDLKSYMSEYELEAFNGCLMVLNADLKVYPIV